MNLLKKEESMIQGLWILFMTFSDVCIWVPITDISTNKRTQPSFYHKASEISYALIKRKNVTWAHFY